MATTGVIYFSMGSNAKSKDLPPEVKNVLLSAFKELPFTVLWKYEEDELPGRPENVKIAKWLPQQDVLSKSVELILQKKFYWKPVYTYQIPLLEESKNLF